MSLIATRLMPAFDAIVSIKARIPEDAMSAGLLGTERSGHGVRIRDDGLIATIGYVVNEADMIWIGSRDGTTVPGVAIGYDFESGFGLVRPTLPLPGATIEIGSAASLSVGDNVLVVGSDAHDDGLAAEVVAKREFAGRWEYLLDEAVFTAPPHESWSGAALLDTHGRLCGIGSLAVQNFDVDDTLMTVNMFVPIELLMPIIDDLCEQGRRRSPPRPWLGLLVDDSQDRLMVVGVYRNCPGDRAGLKPGDLIVGIDGTPVDDLATLFRRVWRLGSAGTEVPLSVVRNGEEFEAVVRSADRALFQRKGTMQ
ncbi:MAG TPA: S1C family serine protease [Gammaproteobacteria bacterium]